MFSAEEQLKTGTVITGLPGYGKTNWAKILADILMTHGVRVYVFDPSQAWRNSNLPRTQALHTKDRVIIVKDSTVYDISDLILTQQKGVVTWFTDQLYRRAVRGDPHIPIVCVFEEAQLYFGNSYLRSKVGERLLRYVSVGRNFNLHFMLVSRRLAYLSTDAVGACGQRYHTYTDERSDWNRAKNYLHEWSKQLGELEVGEFIYKRGKAIRRIETVLHVQYRVPKPIYKRWSFWRR